MQTKTELELSRKVKKSDNVTIMWNAHVDKISHGMLMLIRYQARLTRFLALLKGHARV